MVEAGNRFCIDPYRLADGIAATGIGGDDQRNRKIAGSLIRHLRILIGTVDSVPKIPGPGADVSTGDGRLIVETDGIKLAYRCSISESGYR